jgi:hypothetical protein
MPVELSQFTDPHLQTSALLLGDVPSEMSQIVDVILLHWLRPATQNMPVVSAFPQSAPPHLQATAFSDVPSTLVQVGHSGREHVLDLVLQTIPVPVPSPFLLHAVLPQMHPSSSFLFNPSLQANCVASWWHSLRWQNMPVFLPASQSAVPHAQVSLFGAIPLVFLQIDFSDSSKIHRHL